MVQLEDAGMDDDQSLWHSLSSPARAALSDPAAVARMQELKKLPKPPQLVKDVFAAALIALGESAEPVWSDAVKILQSSGAKGLASRLCAFEPVALTPQQFRALNERCNWSPGEIKRVCFSAAPIAMWVLAVRTFGEEREKSLTNFAVLSAPLRRVPYEQASCCAVQLGCPVWRR
jgi:hypothetical protein